MTTNEIINKHDMLNAKRTITSCTDTCGNCSNCGECCSSVLPWTKEEIEIVKKYYKEHTEIHKKVKSNCIPLKNKVTRKYDVNLQCPFRDRENKKCMIYEVRPEICRRFKCNKNKLEMIKDRTECEVKGDYNNINVITGEYVKRMVTTWELFNLPLINHNIFLMFEFKINPKDVRAIRFLNTLANIDNEYLKQTLDFLNKR